MTNSGKLLYARGPATATAANSANYFIFVLFTSNISHLQPAAHTSVPVNSLRATICHRSADYTGSQTFQPRFVNVVLNPVCRVRLKMTQRLQCDNSVNLLKTADQGLFVTLQ